MYKSISTIFNAMTASQSKANEHVSQPDTEPELPSAVRVFCVSELLEQILHEVAVFDLKTVLLAQRVNRQFHHTIAGSIILRRDLFFELNPPKEDTHQPDAPESPYNIFVKGIKDESPNAPRLNPFLHYEGDCDVRVLRAATCGNNACFRIGLPWTECQPDYETSRTWFLHLKAGWISPLNFSDEAAANQDASWRKMWTTDPPIRIHRMDEVLEGGEAAANRVCSGKMGPLMDAVKEISTYQRGNNKDLSNHYQYIAPRRMKIPQPPPEVVSWYVFIFRILRIILWVIPRAVLWDIPISNVLLGSIEFCRIVVAAVKYDRMRHNRDKEGEKRWEANQREEKRLKELQDAEDAANAQQLVDHFRAQLRAHPNCAKSLERMRQEGKPYARVTFGVAPDLEVYIVKLMRGPET